MDDIGMSPDYGRPEYPDCEEWICLGCDATLRTSVNLGRANLSQ